MKAIFLAAGEGSRLRPLTITTPKPLIQICGKSILEHNLDAIYSHVEEIVLVVKYKPEAFKKYFGNSYKGTPITYHLQGDKTGTGGALMGIESELDVIILNGDMIIQPADLLSLLEFNGYGVLVQKVENPEKYGIFHIDHDNNIDKVVEKPQDHIGDLASLGFFKLHPKILELCNQLEISERLEYELTDAINNYVKQFPLKAIEIQGKFLDISYPWDILDANAYFLNNMSRSEISGEIEDNVQIKGNIILEEGAILKSGTYIEGNCYIGKNTIVGPNAYLRGPIVLGNNCKVGNAVEIKNSCYGNNVCSAHLSYIGDSVLGNDINLGGGFSAASLRHDNKDIRVMVKGELISTKKRKFGTIIGDNVKTGVNTAIMPGRILESGSFTLPGEIIK